MCGQRLSSIIVLKALALIVLIGGWGLTIGCGGSSSPAAATADPVAPTSDQASTIGTAAIDLTLDAMSSALSSVQGNIAAKSGSKSLAKSKDMFAPESQVTVTATASCEQTTVTACDTPLQSIPIEITGDVSGSCAGTIQVCSSTSSLTLTCTNFATQDGASTVFNGTLSLSQNNDSCDIGSSVSAAFTTTVNSESCDVTAAFTTAKSGTDLTISGCVTVCGSGFEISTTSSASTVATCSSDTCPVATDITALAALFAGTECTGSLDEGGTVSYDQLVSSEMSTAQIGCLLNAACVAAETDCVSVTVATAVNETCALEIGGGGDDPEIGEIEDNLADCSGEPGHTCALISAQLGEGWPVVNTELTALQDFPVDVNDVDNYFKLTVGGLPIAAVDQTCIKCSASSDFTGGGVDVKCTNGANGGLAALFMDFATFDRETCFGNALATEGDVYFKLVYNLMDSSTIASDPAFGLHIILPMP